MYGKLNFRYNVTKNNKIHRLPPVSRVVVTLCVYGGFWSGLDANRRAARIENLNSRPNHFKIRHKHKESRLHEKPEVNGEFYCFSNIIENLPKT